MRILATAQSAISFKNARRAVLNGVGIAAIASNFARSESGMALRTRATARSHSRSSFRSAAASAGEKPRSGG